MLRMLTKATTKGFTIVELIVAVGVAGILMGLLFGPLNDLYTSSNKGLKSVIQTADTRTALRTIEEGITLSVAFQNTNSVNDPLGSNNNASSPTQWNWQGIGGSNPNSRVLITSGYATNELEDLDTDGNRSLINDPDCSTPTLVNYVYFVSAEVLYRRTITPASKCSTDPVPAQQLTCAQTVTNSACGTPARRDAKIISGVKRFSVDYYVSSDAATKLSDSDPNTPTTARTIVITLEAATGTGTNEIRSNGKIRITRINGATS